MATSELANDNNCIKTLLEIYSVGKFIMKK